jgi:membrane-associated phospholipid phosphatase
MTNENPSEKGFSAKSLWRNHRQLILVLVLWAVYLTAFFWLKHIITPMYYIYSPLDDRIPFVKWFFPVYCLWYPYLVLPLLYLYFTARRDFMKLQYYLFTGFFICVAFYAVYPNAIDFRPAVTGNDWISAAMRAMYSIDPSNMVTPSMHVYSSVAILLGLTQSEKTRKKRGLLLFSLVLTLLICASTVLVKQHSIIDVFWGILLALVLFIPYYFRRKKPRTR